MIGTRHCELQALRRAQVERHMPVGHDGHEARGQQQPQRQPRHGQRENPALQAAVTECGKRHGAGL